MTTDRIPTGSFLEENDNVYHQYAKDGRAISASSMKLFRKSPRDYQARYITKEIKQKDSPALVLGRAAHALILEGTQAFMDGFVRIDELCPSFGFINPKTGSMYGETTKAFREAKAALEDSKPGVNILSKEQWDQCQGMAEAVRQHPIAKSLFADGDAERAFRKYVGEEPFARQCKIDFVADTGSGYTTLVDLKTTEDLDMFPRNAHRFGYPEQLAFYRDLFIKTLDNGCGCTSNIDVVIVAVEKNPPFKVAVANIPHAVLKMKQDENEHNIARLAALWHQEGSWPTGYEGVQSWFVPEPQL